MEQEKLTNQKDTIAFLCNKYPKCFITKGPIKPLKIGIFQDLASELEGSDIVSKRLLRVSLRHYTSSWRYLSAIKAGAARINLAGEDGELVEEQHATHAAEQLKESKEKAAKHRESNPKTAKASIKHKGYVKDKETDSGDESAQPAIPKAPKKARASAASHPKRAKNSDRKAALPEIVQVPISTDEILVGHQALVKLGKEPMPVTITDIGKDGISVQLKSGMTVKVQKAQLFSSQKVASK